MRWIIRRCSPVIWHEEVLRLRAVDRVTEAPAAEGLAGVAIAALRVVPEEIGQTLSARRDRAHEHGFSDRVARNAASEFRDHVDRLMPNAEPRPDRILPAHDVQVRPADRGRRDPDQRFLSRRGAADLPSREYHRLRGGAAWCGWGARWWSWRAAARIIALRFRRSADGRQCDG